MNPAAIGQSVTNAFQQGVEVRKTRETDNALAQYALSPSADTAAQVARFDPRTGIQLGEYERKRAADAQKTQQAAMTQQLAGRAAQGDKKALLSLWGVDWETASKLDKFQTDKAIEGMEFMANAAYQIATLPPEQQAIAADQFIDQGVALGFDGLAQYKGQVTPQMLQAFVAKAGEMKPFMEYQQPKYVPVGEGGLSGFQYGRPIMQDGAPQDFGPPAPAGVTFTPLDGGPQAAPAATFP